MISLSETAAWDGHARRRRFFSRAPTEQQAAVLAKAPKLGALALCWLALSIPLLLFADSAKLTGRVTDPAGSAVPGARLTLASRFPKRRG